MRRHVDRNMFMKIPCVIMRFWKHYYCIHSSLFGDSRLTLPTSHSVKKCSRLTQGLSLSVLSSWQNPLPSLRGIQTHARFEPIRLCIIFHSNFDPKPIWLMQTYGTFPTRRARGLLHNISMCALCGFIVVSVEHTNVAWETRATFRAHKYSLRKLGSISASRHSAPVFGPVAKS